MFIFINRLFICLKHTFLLHSQFVLVTAPFPPMKTDFANQIQNLGCSNLNLVFKHPWSNFTGDALKCSTVHLTRPGSLDWERWDTDEIGNS